MKNWQKNRNYKRVKDKDGNVVANIITVFGQDVEVSDEIFTAYMQMDNHARYIMEDAPKGKELSLEQMMEDGAPIETTVYDAWWPDYYCTGNCCSKRFCGHYLSV